MSLGMNLASFGRNSSNLADLSSLLKNSITPELREVLKSAGTAEEAADAAKSNAMMMQWTFIFADCLRFYERQARAIKCSYRILCNLISRLSVR